MSDTKHSIAVMGDVLPELWDDIPARGACWATLRDQAAILAAEASMALTSDPDFGRHVMFMRFIDDSEGNPMAVETTRGHAEVVKLRCCFWAATP